MSKSLSVSFVTVVTNESTADIPVDLGLKLLQPAIFGELLAHGRRDEERALFTLGHHHPVPEVGGYLSVLPISTVHFLPLRSDSGEVHTSINRHARAHTVGRAVGLLHTDDPLGDVSDGLERGSTSSVGSVGSSAAPEHGDKGSAVRVGIVLSRRPVYMSASFSCRSLTGV